MSESLRNVDSAPVVQRRSQIDPFYEEPLLPCGAWEQNSNQVLVMRCFGARSIPHERKNIPQ